MAGKGNTKYGLILKKKPSSVQLKPSIFAGDNSDDENKEIGRKTVNVTIRKEAGRKKQMKQTQLEIDKVLEEDPTAYDYDEVYDKMAERKANLLAAKTATDNKKPKYISSLLKFAEVRKKEEERRVERQVQKEREAEGSEFADKDAFVTSAYRQKMQEMAEEEERQRRQDERDGDVTKQADLSKFYRNLLDRNVSTGGSFATEQCTDADKDNTNKSRPSLSLGTKEHRKVEREERSSEDERTDRERKGETSTERRDTSRRDTKRPRARPREHDKRERQHEGKTEKHDDEQHESGQLEKAKRDMQDSEEHKMESSKKRQNVATGSEMAKEKDKSENVDSGKSDKNISGSREEEKTYAVDKFAKHSSQETVMSARERYMARKRSRVVVDQTSSDDEN